jgi:hypothetical protein
MLIKPECIELHGHESGFHYAPKQTTLMFEPVQYPMA